jgi:hypothetical protein
VTTQQQPILDHAAKLVASGQHQCAGLRDHEDRSVRSHRCCQSTDPKTVSGEGCHPIGPEHIVACNEVLYCEGTWVKHDGKVHCV